MNEKEYALPTGLRGVIEIMLAKLTWTDDRVVTLRKLASQHLSTHEMSLELGVSRNAVIGKLNRLGLSTSGKQLGVHRPRVSLKPRPIKHVDPHQRITPAEINRINSHVSLPGLQETPNQDDQLIPVEQRKTLMQLNGSDCHWPVGDPLKKGFFFCGGTTSEESSYCECHRLRATATRITGEYRI